MTPRDTAGLRANAAGRQEACARLERADTWVFDLDNTLYPAETDFFSQIDLRIGAFIADLMGLDRRQARKVQKDYFSRYGTTLKGLMDIHDVDPEIYMGYVHDVDLSLLSPDATMIAALNRLRGRKFVFTNSPASYAQRILERLEIDGMIDGIFDAAASGYVPKPQQPAYDGLVATYGLIAEQTVLVEDMVRNLTPAARMGMITVWLKTGAPWGAIDYQPDHVHFEIDDLAGWLTGLVSAHISSERGDFA